MIVVKESKIVIIFRNLLDFSRSHEQHLPESFLLWPRSFLSKRKYPVYEGCLIPTPNIYFFILNIFMHLPQERYKLITPNISQSVYHCYNVHVSLVHIGALVGNAMLKVGQKEWRSFHNKQILVFYLWMFWHRILYRSPSPLFFV